MAKAKKKKKFFDVEIPLIKKETQLQAYELKELNKRLINYDLTRILKGKSALIQLEVKSDEEKATTSPRMLKLLPVFIKRMVRKGTNYVEDSFSTETKDSQIRLKPFLVTRKKVPRSVRKALREKAREELINYAKEQTTEEIFKDILRNSLQKDLSLKLKKIYPLSLCEIRVIKVEERFENKNHVVSSEATKDATLQSLEESSQEKQGVVLQKKSKKKVSEEIKE